MTRIDSYKGFHDFVVTVDVKQCQLVSLSLLSLQAPVSPMALTLLEEGSIYQYEYLADQGLSYIKEFKNTFQKTPNCDVDLPAILTPQNRLNDGTFVETKFKSEVFEFNYEAQRLDVNTFLNSKAGTYYFQVSHIYAKDPSLTALGQIIQINVNKRPNFSPFFSEPLDQMATVELNKEMTFQFPNHTFYDWESPDSCQMRIKYLSKDPQDVYDPVQDMDLGKS